jgi:hypothetical protein
LATMSRTGSMGKRFMRGLMGMMLRIGLGGSYLLDTYGISYI